MLIEASELSALKGIRHAFFTREGGVSTGLYGSLNGGLGSADDPGNVEENRRRMTARLDLPAEALVSLHQVHSADAVAVARLNAERHGVSGRMTFTQGDLLTPLAPFIPFDVIASNPPYVAIEEIETLAPEVREWEPRVALGTHTDALHFYRRFADEAPPLLAPGGLLAVEVGQGQAEAVAELWRAAGMTHVSVTRDYAGIPRVVTGSRPQS